MLKIKLSVKNIFIGIVISITLVWFFTFLIPVIPAFQGINGKKVLLQKTDYYELLKAGRELINQAEVEEYVAIKDGKRGSRLIIPKDVKLPKVIRMLQLKMFGLPGGLNISNDRCLRIDYSHRVVENFGVLIFPEDFNKPESKYINHDYIMLIPGLWYFDDGLNEEFKSIGYGPEYRKWINKLIKKNKYLKNN